GASGVTSSATGSSAGASAACSGVSSAAASGVSSAFVSGVLFSSAISRRQPLFALVAHGEDPRDLALGELQARAVLERAGRRLETQVEQLLPPVVQRVLELLVCHVPQVSSFQRDP